MLRTMVGRDGIEPPTPGFSVRLGTLNRRLHSRSHVVVRTVTPPLPSAHTRWRRVVPNGTVQVWGKSPARVTRGSDALRYTPHALRFRPTCFASRSLIRDW